MKSHQTNITTFSKTAPYYDIVYGKRNTTQDCDTIVRHLNHELEPHICRTLLDLGSGTGTHDLEFWRQGIDVTGIDRAAEMTAIAKKKAAAQHAKITYLTRDILSFSTEKKYDAAVSLFDVLSYMTTDEQVEQYFNVASKALRPKGVFMFDCWYGPGVLLSKPQIVKQTYHTPKVSITRIKTPKVSYEHNTVTVHQSLKVHNKDGEITHANETHTLRYFFNPEIIGFASRAGLKILSWGSLAYPLHKTDVPSWSVYFIAKKVK